MVLYDASIKQARKQTIRMKAQGKMDLWILAVSAAAAAAVIFIIKSIIKKTVVFRKKQPTGISLEVYLESKGGRVLFEEALALLEPVARKLAEMHTNGLCHLDVCPQTITVDPETRKAALLERESAAVIRPGYSAPEQYNTGGKTGTWTDAYALAAVLYRMAAGKNPPDASVRLRGGDAVAQTINRLAADECKRDVWQKALNLTKESRIVNCGQMALDLYAADDESGTEIR